jgi:hypothetical protein
MGLHDVIAAGHQGQCFSMLARRFMISEKQAAIAVQRLLPALTEPFEAWVSTPTGLDVFLTGLSRGGHERTLENPALFSNQFERDRGSQLLAQFRQAREIESAEIGRAAMASGVSYRVLLQLMPYVALFLMAALRTTLEPPAREILVRRLGPSHGRSPDPFADLAELVRNDARGHKPGGLGGLFSSLLTRRSSTEDARGSTGNASVR